MTSLDFATQVGLGVAVLGLLAAIGVRFVTRAGFPALLLFLVIGIALGRSGAGIEFDNAQLATILGYLALVVILAEGGLTTRAGAVVPVLAPSVALASVGVAVSMTLVAGALHLLLGMPWIPALMIGAALSPTDAAAVFTVVRGLRLPSRLRSILEVESGFNDAPVVVILSIITTVGGVDLPLWVVPAVVAAELIGGAAIGVGVGYGARWLLPRVALPASGLYPVALISLIGISYGVAALAHCSGFVAVYITSVMLSTSALPHRRAVLGFVEGLAWTMQIGMFVMLGLLASSDQISAALLPALVAGVVLMVLARPASVFVSLAPFLRSRGWLGWTRAMPIPVAWQGFIAWAGLRGAVPMIFATIPLGAGSPDGRLVFDVILIIVILLTLLQSPTVPWLARRLNLVVLDQAGDVDVDSAPLDDMGASLLSVEVPRRSALAGTYVSELTLPRSAVVSLVIREGTSIVPDRHTRIRQSDRLLIVTTETDRPEAERALRAVSRKGRLAAWRGEAGHEE